MKRKKSLQEKSTKIQTPRKKLKLQTTDIEDLEKYFPIRHHIPRVREELVNWFDKNKRNLPWRVDNAQWIPNLSTPNNASLLSQRAYEVWVSEIMLQQTRGRVQTVIEYYNKWMKTFPTIKDLSEASLEKVNEEWSGLGYYRRAKHLLNGAKTVIEKYNGEMPTSAKDLQNLPGIGQYTAGAIASIVFNEKTPLVDGNVIRVISRLCSIDLNPKLTTTTKMIWKICEEMVSDADRPGCFNQSLMELGATVCTPTNPSCGECPVRTQCTAYAKQTADQKLGGSFSVTDYPIKVKKAAPRDDTVLVCILAYHCSGDDGDEATMKKNNNKGKNEQSVLTHQGMKFLIKKRPESGLLASLWEFPSIELHLKNNTNGNNDDDEIEGEDDDNENNDDDEGDGGGKGKRKKNMLTNCSLPSLPQKKDLAQKYISKTFGIDLNLNVKQTAGANIDHYSEVGETSHLFTHIKQKLIVDLIVIHSNHIKSLPSPKESHNVRWLSFSELEDAALSKGMRKCLDLAVSHLSNRNRTKQTSLSNYFTKSNLKATK